jgi:uncharacterized protein (DUF305 family)
MKTITRRKKMNVNQLASLTMTSLAAIALAFPALAGGHAPSRAQQVFEIRFMEDMIGHHQMALMTAMIVVQKWENGELVHEELKDLAGEIIAAQEEEIGTLRGWLQDWYGIMHHSPHTMNPGHARMIEKLESLTGEEFEIAFMQHMILHHAGAVVTSLNCTKRAYHMELIDLCETMAEMQLHEIMMMKEWLEDWYGISRGKSHTRMGGVQTSR